MKAAPKFVYVAVLVISTFTFAACNNSGAPAAKFTIGGTVVNLAGCAGGLVLQDDMQNNLSVNANGTFRFASTVPSGTAYSITIGAQPSNPAQTCSITSGSGIATADVTNIEVNCGHNEWAWIKGPNTVSGTGVYGTLGVPAANNTPGPRQTPATWTDGSGNFWLFGGNGFASQTYSLMNDLWKFSSGEWTWVGGSDIGGQAGTYGSLGVPATSNFPGARYYAASWTDTSGNLWLFGGYRYDANGNNGGMLNDLWKYSNGEWTWESGSQLMNQPGVYGTQGLPAPGNVPGARDWSVVWTDSSGNLWLFGGTGYPATGLSGWLNDLWKYSNLWMYMP